MPVRFTILISVIDIRVILANTFNVSSLNGIINDFYGQKNAINSNQMTIYLLEPQQ